MSSLYSYPAEFYDALQSGVDYRAYCDFAIKTAEKFNMRPKTALDLACGTGAIAMELDKMSLDVTAVDISDEMLCVLYERIRKSGSDILVLCQDMRELDLNDTVDMAVCALDGMNYLLDTKSLKKALERVYLFLSPGGVFIFDMNTEYKFRNIYGCRDYVLENDGVLCAWQNNYNPKTKKCDFILSFFEECPDGRYQRFDEIQTERCYSKKTVLRLAREVGFEECGVYSDFDYSEVGDESERMYFVLRKKG